MTDPTRPRGREAVSFPSSRRAVTAAVRAGRRVVPMHGLLDVDVTDVRRLLDQQEPPLSMTAFVIAAVARAAAAHPEVHAYRDWRGRLVRHRHVDVQTLVQVRSPVDRYGHAWITPSGADWVVWPPGCAGPGRRESVSPTSLEAAGRRPGPFAEARMGPVGQPPAGAEAVTARVRPQR